GAVLKASSTILLSGIVGGFAGPDPREIHTIIKHASSSSIVIQSLVRPTSSAPLTPLIPRRLPISQSPNAARALADIRAILEGIPMEKPRGSEDIYGEDTALRWESEDFQWFNGGPEGCAGGGRSWVQPTEKEKEGFKRAVDIVRDLVRTSA
ncbi:hypothetical protein H0H87_000227, partial [Tephrocybe sp. NHM501043]